MSNKQLLILAGGKGTRLCDRLGGKPKSLIEIAGKPLLDYQMTLAGKYGFQDVHLLLGYEAKQIRDYCGDGSKWGVTLHYHEEPQPIGTAGAVLRILDQLAERFIIMYGDTMLDVDLDRFFKAHKSSKASVTLFVHPNDHPHDSDLVELDDESLVINFHPYPHSQDSYLPNLVNAALYVAEKSALAKIEYDGGVLDFGKHVFPALLQQGNKIYGYKSVEYIKDIGTPKRVDTVSADLWSGKVASRAAKCRKKAIFLDRDGTINLHSGHISNLDNFVLLPRVAEAIGAINRSEYLCIVITNQPVIARGEIDEMTLNQIHYKMETLLGRGRAYIDALYYCPHHPDKGFPNERKEYKIICQCRKPAIGLLKKAEQDLNLDLAQSWFIGDSTVDVETAKRAGMKSILLQTGVAGADKKFASIPDFKCTDLMAATKAIINY